MKIVNILVLGALAVVAILGSMTWVLVDVDAHGPDGVRIFVPAPLALADVAVRFIPEASKPVDVPIEPEHHRLIRAALAEIATAGDFEMVRVEERDETVVVRVEEGLLHVAVDTPTEQVRVRFPIRSLKAALNRIEDKQIRPRDLLVALDDLPSGRLVEVHSEDADVKISVW